MVCFGTAQRFKPSDKQILAHLLYTVNERPIPCEDHDFAKKDLYGVKEPWEIIDLESRKDNYYFTRRKRSSSNPGSFNLGIGKGVWEVCGPKVGIVDKRNQEVGFKQCYQYKLGEEEIPDRDLGRWEMEEYTLADRFDACVKDEYVDFALCSINFVRDDTMISSDIDAVFEEVLSENRASNSNSSRSSRICKASQGWSCFGNHHAMIIVWSILGLVSATVSPIFLLPKPKYYVPCMIAEFFVTLTFYAVRFLIRRRAVMRERRNWWQTILCNLLVAAITIASSYLHKATTRGMIGQSLIAVAVFGLMEISKPVFDFGTLQFCLRQPLQTAAQISPHRIWHFIITGVLLLVGTMWQAYYLHLFNQLVENQRIEAARFDEDRQPQLILQASQGDGLQPILDQESQAPCQSQDQSPTRQVE